MACVRWSSGSRTTRAPPPSNANWHAAVTFGSALEFSLFPLKRTGILREAPWAKLVKRSANMAWWNGRRRAQFAAQREGSNRERRLQPTIRFRRPGVGRAMAKLPMIAEWNARLPRVARQGQSCPLTVYAGVVGQGPSVWQGSNAPWRNPARPSDNRAGGPISRGIRLVTNCIESADAASTT